MLLNPVLAFHVRRDHSEGMKVLHSCQSLSRTFGGVFEAVRQLVAEQARLEWRPEIRVAGTLDEFTETDRPLWQGCEVCSYPVLGPRAIGWSLSLSRLYREFSPDVVQVHGLWMYYSILNERYCRRKRVPYLVSPHGMLDSWALRNSSLKKSIARMLFEDQHLRNAGCLHALCTEEAEAIRRLGFQNPICVVPNGVVLPESNAAVPLPSPWSGLVPSGSPILLFLGRLHPKKGVDNLIEAWSMLRNVSKTCERAEWRLVLAGWGEPSYVDKLKAKVRHLHLERDVFFVGPLFGEAKNAAFHHAKAFVLPSYSEGLPMAVLEAWSHQLPVLMTPACNLSVGFEWNAAIRLGTEVSELVGPLTDFLRLTDLDQQAIGVRGFDLVVARFTWQRIARDLGRVYDWIAKETTQPTDLLFSN